MSTRALITIKDSFGMQQHFYRHSDGYPSGTLPTLEKFLGYVKSGKIRDNVSQSCGWLVVIGMQEYADGQYGRPEAAANLTSVAPAEGISGWKVGSYEPVTQTDVGQDYTYVIDLTDKTITVKNRHDNA